MHIAMIGMQELVIILLVLVLLFGARKLPELARSMGSSITEFKKGIKQESESLPEGENDETKDEGS